MKAFALGGAATLALLAWAFVEPRVVLAGWLVGLVFWLGLALGALLLLAVHALTGGAWMTPLRPVLERAAATLPVFALLALPLAMFPSLLFPWAANPAALRPDILHWYLNPAGLALRGAVALAGWSVLGMLIVRRPSTPLGVATLMFQALASTVIGLDWVLSIDPHFHSTVFGLALSLTQILTALAWCALLAPEAPGEEGRAGDLAQMLIAAALGAVYLGFAQFLVSWYGNAPDKAAWFLRREATPWIWIEGVSVVLNVFLPIGALLLGRMRRSPHVLRVIGIGLMVGVTLHTIWLIGPEFGIAALPASLLGSVAVGGLWLGVLGFRRSEVRHVA